MISASDLSCFYDFATAADAYRPLFEARRRFAQGIDPATISANIGVTAALPVWFDEALSRFDLEPMRGVEPRLAIIAEVLDLDGETTFDLVAWPIDQPERLSTYSGPIAMLGEAQVRLHPQSALSAPLPIWRTVGAWLRADGIGCVPIDGRLAARTLLLFSDAPFSAEDDRHGRQLLEARADALSHASPILVACEAA